MKKKRERYQISPVATTAGARPGLAETRNLELQLKSAAWVSEPTFPCFRRHISGELNEKPNSQDSETECSQVLTGDAGITGAGVTAL